MHTFTASDGTVFIYNPDLSDVRVNVHNDDIEDISYITDTTTAEPLSQVTVSGQALKEFIGEYFRREMISNLESIDIIQFLKDM